MFSSLGPIYTDLVQLPLELIGVIASHSSVWVLKNLATASRACQREAEPILYECVTLCRKRHAIQGLQAIVDSVERASYVRAFAFNILNPKHKHRLVMHTLLQQALLAMTGLKHLEIRSDKYFYKDDELLNALRYVIFMSTWQLSNR